MNTDQSAAQPRGQKAERHISEELLKMVLGNRLGSVSNFLRRRIAGQARRLAQRIHYRLQPVLMAKPEFKWPRTPVAPGYGSNFSVSPLTVGKESKGEL